MGNVINCIAERTIPQSRQACHYGSHQGLFQGCCFKLGFNRPVGRPREHTYIIRVSIFRLIFFTFSFPHYPTLVW